MIRFIFDNYIGTFYKHTYKGKHKWIWKKLQTIGNTGVGLDVCKLLEKLGYKVEYVDQSKKEEE